MIAILKQLMRARLNLLLIACPLALIPFIMAATSYSPSVFGTHADWLRDTTVVRLTDLSEVNRMVQLKGSLIARSHDNTVTDLILTVASTAGAAPINLDANPFVITYQDQHQRVSNLPWSAQFQGEYNGDNLLEEKELVQLTIRLSDAPQVTLGPNTPFVVEVSPPQGPILTIQMATPPKLDPITVLDL